MQDELDRLYQAPLSGFVAARNELASTLKKAGETDRAKEVKALAKPSASAWAVNQLYWTERELFDRLIAAGDRYREALSTTGADELAETARQDVVGEATRRARDILAESGESASDTVMRRVATTLDALASYGSANPEPMLGRLSRELEPPGFAAFAELKPAATIAPPEPDTIAQAEEALAERSAMLDAARRRLASATTRIETLRQQLARAEQELSDAAASVAEQEELVERARRALADAERK